MTEVNALVAFVAGVFSFLSPCVLPLIPSYLSFISGVSLEEMRGEQTLGRVKWRVVLNSSAFILGFSLVFVSLGASASYLGSLFLGYRDVIRTVGGIFILVVGLYLMGVFKIATLERYLQFNLSNKPAGYLGSVLVGITFAVAWTPCVGPILGAVLTVAGASADVGRGVFLLASYAAGLGLPFFLSALAINSFFQFSQAFRRYIRAFHVASGVLLAIVGVLLLTDYMTFLNAYALRFTPEWLLKRL
ncbi:MAG: cytochrome c biogenesis protein CcdA [Deltaproteobacteria bacterium]|nr:cytochrome c biogenesis protein CcdA [Deltaproteobacteria bacterium]MDZ4341877.1 cytochrome c biogenesis protein CcdA [Candidatus Binatia bacterium]